VARGNRPLQMNFEQQLRALVYFHLEEHTSGRHLIQALEEDDFARNHIAPPDGIQLTPPERLRRLCECAENSLSSEPQISDSHKRL